MGTTHLLLLACVWNFLPYPLVHAGFLRPAAHEGVLKKAYPFRTSTRLRIAAGCQSHTIFAQRGSVCVNLYVLRIAADGRNVNGSLAIWIFYTSNTRAYKLSWRFQDESKRKSTVPCLILCTL